MPTPRDPANAATANDTPPTLYQSGDFIVSGAAELPGPLAVSAIGTYARLWTEELKSEIRVTMDDDVAAKFEKAVEEATAVVSAASVLTRPGEKPDGTYSNAFLAVRASDAKTFADRFAEVMRQWNEMNKSDEDESRLLFETETEKIGNRTATTYSMDMVEAFGTAAIPEVRPSMERLFGPGGKLRLMMVPIDEHIVLLAAATIEQVDARHRSALSRQADRLGRTHEPAPAAGSRLASDDQPARAHTVAQTSNGRDARTRHRRAAGPPVPAIATDRRSWRIQSPRNLGRRRRPGRNDPRHRQASPPALSITLLRNSDTRPKMAKIQHTGDARYFSGIGQRWPQLPPLILAIFGGRSLGRPGKLRSGVPIGLAGLLTARPLGGKKRIGDKR